MPVMVTTTEWDLHQWHGVHGAAREWVITREGIWIRDEGASPRRPTSSYRPELAKTVWQQHRQAILDACRASWDPGYFDPRAALVATICNESAGDVRAERKESHLNDHSLGCCQILTSTALTVARSLGWPREVPDDANLLPIPRRSIPMGGDVDAWREFLFDPDRSIMFAGRLHRLNDERDDRVRGDPVLLYAMYNAGSLRPTDSNPWGLVSTNLALDAFVQFYNAAATVISASEPR